MLTVSSMRAVVSSVGLCTAADRTLRQRGDSARLAKWSGRAALAVPRRSRSRRTRSRCQRQLSARLRGNDRAKPERPPHGASQPMKQVAATACPRSRVSRVALLVFFGTAIFGITACSLSGPAPAEYVLGAMPAATETTIPQTGLRVVAGQSRSASRLPRHDRHPRAQRQSARPEPDWPLGRAAIGRHDPGSDRFACRPAAPSGRDGDAAWASDTTDSGRCGRL